MQMRVLIKTENVENGPKNDQSMYDKKNYKQFLILHTVFF